jgi:hypothetical protein
VMTTPYHLRLYCLVSERNNPRREAGARLRERARRSVSDTGTFMTKRDEPILYEIRLQGHLDEGWATWFEGLTITLEDNGVTRLTGPVADQAALHGLLKKVRDLGLPLLTVAPIAPDQSPTADSGQ